MSKKKNNKEEAKTKKSKYLKQSDVPKWSLEKAIEVAQAIQDNFAGDPTSPLEVAAAMEISPTSSNWQEIPGSSVAYGLTKGSYNASEISITALGKRVVAPEEENDDLKAIVEASLIPRVLGEFFNKYSGNKFPKEQIAKNVLVGMGVPKNKVDNVLQIILENGEFAGILQEIKGNNYINLQNIKKNGPTKTEEEEKGIHHPSDDIEELPEELQDKLGITKNVETKDEETKPETIDRVFISHGKNKKIVEQLKEILKFGKFETIVSVEKESTAISVPEKVFADMRKCNAAVIHIEGEEVLMDSEGNTRTTINQNVLIEIGAAIALYGKNFVLLCEKSLKLPSNLQGLYRCNYEGKQLDYEATMKLLKSFNEFK